MAEPFGLQHPKRIPHVRGGMLSSKRGPSNTIDNVQKDPAAWWRPMQIFGKLAFSETIDNVKNKLNYSLDGRALQVPSSFTL